MLDITSEQISLLDDKQLRNLVALLCEAELRRQGHSSSCVTAGGAQTAADGGLDVVVQLPPSAAKEHGYVPKSFSGYQVKAEDMPRAKIAEEMAPTGKLREAIKELIAAKGAYIIVSSKGSVARTPLKDRKAAMRDAVASEAGAEDLELDFFDRTRLASWVRENPGLIAWVRRAIGQPLTGWDPYGTWSLAGKADATPYFLDEAGRVRDTRAGNESTVSIKEGIQRLRSLLAAPGSVLRLVGLSGTGKTRLLEALFDPKVGEDALDPSLAHYTDMANEPLPAPREVALHLSTSRNRAILVVDNCPPSVHKSIANVCLKNEFVSVITVEYDVRDEATEDTGVFVLEPASEAVIATLVRKRYPSILQPDAERIADASGGNARLALAIAQSLPDGATLTGKPYGDLFSRLFFQRGEVDNDLLRCASVCALVYSFGTEADSSEADELSVLAGIAEVSKDRLYGYVASLMERQLVQSRSHWRAVLPQALAAWLAKKALASIPLTSIESALCGAGTSRLARSFSRRLGDLHDSPQAQQLVRQWLAPGGLLGRPERLDEMGKAMLRNVAPVDPKTALAAVVRAIEAPDDDDGYSLFSRRSWVPLLYCLAYEAELFGQAVDLIVRIKAQEKQPAREISLLTSLFQSRFSGTLAPLDIRIQAIERMFAQDNQKVDQIAIECLRHLLSVECRGGGIFQFGARPRTYGYWPSTAPEVGLWYSQGLAFVSRLAAQPWRLKVRVKAILARSFQSLWRSSIPCEDALEAAVDAVMSQGHWGEGWIAAQNTLRRKSAKEMSPEKRARLEALERRLRAASTSDMARTYLMSKRWDVLDVADSFAAEGADGMRAAQERVETAARELGKTLAGDAHLFNTLLSDLVSSEAHRARPFGEGIAEATEDLEATWRSLVQAFTATPPEHRGPDVLCGFLAACGTRAPALQLSFEEEALEHPSLGSVFPILQLSGSQDSQSFTRLMRSIRSGRAGPWGYREIWRVPGSSDEFGQAVLAVASLKDAFPVALNALHMRMHVQSSDHKVVDDALRHCGRELLQLVSFDYPDSDSLSYELGEVAATSFEGEAAADSAKRLCERIRDAIADHRTSAYTYRELLGQLFRRQPRIALDVFFGNDGEDLGDEHVYVDHLDTQRLLDQVDFEAVKKWIAVDPIRRTTIAARLVTAIAVDETTSEAQWTPMVGQLEELTSDKVALYVAIERQLYPSGWSGSLAIILEKRRPLLDSLAAHIDSEVRAWASAAKVRLDNRIATERKHEQTESASFE